MTKENFIAILKSTAPVSKDKMIEACQHYVDNYPINIHGMFVRLPIQIGGGTEESVNRAFTTLQGRVNEF